MKIIDQNGNDIIGTPNLKRGEEYQIQIDFAETIVDSYEEKMTHTPDSSITVMIHVISFSRCMAAEKAVEIKSS